MYNDDLNCRNTSLLVLFCYLTTFSLALLQIRKLLHFIFLRYLRIMIHFANILCVGYNWQGLIFKCGEPCIRRNVWREARINIHKIRKTWKMIVCINHKWILLDTWNGDLENAKLLSFWIKGTEVKYKALIFLTFVKQLEGESGLACST